MPWMTSSPRDDLFVQRALLRGRARTSRRRNSVLGAAAALVVVGAVGGAWWSGSRAAGRARAPARPCRSERSSGAWARTAPATPGRARPDEPADRHTDDGAAQQRLVPGAKDGSAWFTGPTTPSARPSRASSRGSCRSSPTFAGRLRRRRRHRPHRRHRHAPDPALEALVTGAMPSPGDVQFVTVANSYAVKRAVLDQIVADAPQWRAQGVDITGVRIDSRSDRVVVSAVEGLTPGVLARQRRASACRRGRRRHRKAARRHRVDATAVSRGRTRWPGVRRSRWLGCRHGAADLPQAPMSPQEALRRVCFLLERGREQLSRRCVPQGERGHHPHLRGGAARARRSRNPQADQGNRRLERCHHRAGGARRPAGLPRLGGGEARGTADDRRCRAVCRSATCTPTPTGATAAARSRRWCSRPSSSVRSGWPSPTTRRLTVNGLSRERLATTSWAA